MRKKWTVFLAAGLAAVLFAGSSFAQSPEEKTTEDALEAETFAETLDAKAYVETLCAGDAESLTEDYLYTEELLDALNASGGLAGLQASLKSLGELQSAGEPIVSEIGGYISYSVPCVFALQKLNLVLNVDGEGKIAGIVTAAYEENTVAESEEAGDAVERSEEIGEALPAGITEMEVSLPVDGQEGWELPGTLTLPEGDGPFPAVVLVHGSGPNDRDETIGYNKPFRDIAWGLAQKGIAVYRYDKRTLVYGQQLASDPDLTLEEETVLDAVKAVEILAGQEKIDGSRIYVAGHSLGGQALPRINEALAETEAAAGYIFLAAPARKLPDIMKEQYDFLYSLTPELTEEQEQQKEMIYAELARLEDPDSLSETDTVLGAYSAYWKDLDSYDQVETAASIQQPCLVLQGEEDYQVTMEDFGLWKETYGEAPNWSFKTYPGLTHLFMPGEKANGPADYQSAQTVDEQVISDMAEFMKR